MKPRRTPSCFFSNASRYSLRSAITADMSTSLKVVSIAAVFCASFSRAAMVRRRRVMRTRSSRGSVVARRPGGGRRRRRGRRTIEECQHVALGDAPVLAGARADLLGREMLFLDQLRRGRQRRVRGDIGRRRGGTRHRTERARRRIHAGLRHRGGTRRRRLRRLRRGFDPAGRDRAAIQQTQQRADRDLAAFRRADRGQHAGGRRADLHRHLVGLQFDQRFIGGDRVALVLHPARDGGGRDALAQRRAP